MSESISISENISGKIKGVSVKKLKKSKIQKRSGSKSNFSKRSKRGVIYVKHLPHGFYENEMKKYFSQFGKITRLRISRSKRTGGSKGYAFIEFQDEDVAKVAAEAMNDYLMFRKILKSKFMPSDEVHPDLFKRWNRPFSAPKAHLISIKRHNRPHKSEKEVNEAVKKLKSKNAKRLAKIASLGVSYSLPV